MARNVRQHTRTTPSGGTTTVTRHSRRGGRAGKRRALLSPGHAWDLVKRAGRANRRKKTTLAVVLGVLALGEIGAWVTLSGAGLILATFAVLASAAAAAAMAATGLRQ